MRAIAAAHPRAEVLEGGDATVARFLALAPHAPWIHFAGHGVYRAEAPYGSGLQLADGWLSAEALVARRFVAERVVLAACQSARALIQPGEEWFGLARTLLRCGVGQVVAAQWDVGDEAARRFMAGFYARMIALTHPICYRAGGVASRSLLPVQQTQGGHDGKEGQRGYSAGLAQGDSGAVSVRHEGREAPDLG